MLNKTVSFRVDEETYEKLMTLSALKQQNSNENVSTTDVIRDLIEKESRFYTTALSMPISDQYEPVGRKILMEDKLAIKNLPRYERDIAVNSFVIPKRGRVPDMFVEAEELLVPLFRIANTPSWDVDDETETIRKRALERAEDSINRQEDHEIFQCLHYATNGYDAMFDDDETKTGGIWDHIIVTEKPTITDVATACTKIHEHELEVKNIITHPANAVLMADLLNELKEKFTHHPITANILESTTCPRNTIYFAAPPEFVGVVPIRKDLGVLNNPEPTKFQNGYVVYRHLGVAVINDYALSKILIRDCAPEINEEYVNGSYGLFNNLNVSKDEYKNLVSSAIKEYYSNTSE